MPWIDTFKTASPKREELQKGTDVLIYAKNCSHLVAHGTVISETPNDAVDQLRERQMVLVRIKQNDVLVPITKTCVDSRKTLGDLFEGDESSESVNSIETPWKWGSLRIMPEGVKQDARLSGRETNDILSRLTISSNVSTFFDVSTKFVSVSLEAGGAFENGTALITEEDCLAEMERVKNIYSSDSKRSYQQSTGATELSWQD